MSNLLRGASAFSKLEYWSGFHQAKVKKEDIHKTSIKIYCRYNKFLVMPFGKMNALSIFMELMIWVFAPDLGKFLVLFSKGIQVYLKSKKQLIDPSRTILDPLGRRSSMEAKKISWTLDEECIFSSRYHHRSSWSLACYGNETMAYSKFSDKVNLVSRYYWRFVHDFSKIARCLTRLMKREAKFV